MKVPADVSKIIDRFHRNAAAYRSGHYNETQVRREFIDPFFRALGWDVENEQGAQEAYKDVVHEDAIKIGGTTKAPDYSFRVGGARKFFVEAKKPSVNLKDNNEPAFQLRRYAWSANLPLSVLTDFEEFVVYDCRVRPDKTDKSTTARTLYYTYQDYTQSWEEIAGLFSRDAVLSGSIDQYAALLTEKKGVATVDTAFLREIEAWRDVLAKTIAVANPQLSQRDLNFAVQMTLDRIIFLRISEDRGIEPYERLKGLAARPNVYAQLCDLFRDADDRYNSGLFHFAKEKGRPEHPDDLTLSLAIADEPLSRIITSTYYPDSPYEFSVLPIEILGQVYEQFLGKVIRLTPDSGAVVEEKPEVRKAGGVFYTPSYIVDYIVKNTVGKLLEGKTPRQVAKLCILDPACGSGSFLIGAYDFLLDWHRDWYVADGTVKHKKELYQAVGGEWRLTTVERKRILLNNIYGVDIDTQAVEVTKLSLLLKVLEGESQQSLATQLSMFRERALPDLGENIKCGNSLIGSDFYSTMQVNFLDNEEKYRVNVFDWQTGFPGVIQAGGFDAVIGNPPYIRVHRLSNTEKTYFWKRYETFVAKSDLYACFIEKSVSLVRPGGRISFITPNTWTSLESFTNLRKFVLKHTSIEQLVKTPDKVFRDATVKTFIFMLRKLSIHNEVGERQAHIRKLTERGEVQDTGSIAQRDMETAHLHNLLLHSEDAAPTLFAKCTQSGRVVGSAVQFFYGFKTGDDAKFLALEKLTDFHQPYVRSGDISRYCTLSATGFVDYRPDVMKAHRATARPGDTTRFSRPKVLVARMGKDLIATFDDTGILVKDAMLLLSPTDDAQQLKILTGILNSRLLQYLYQNHFATIDVLKNALVALPLPHISNTDSIRYSNQVKELVEHMLTLYKQLTSARTNQDKNIIQRQIEAIDKQIDRLVYQLYDLTEEEIQIVD